MSETSKHFDAYVDTARLEALLAYVTEKRTTDVMETSVAHGDAVLVCKRVGVVPLLRFLRDDKECEFKLLVDLCGVDVSELSDASWGEEQGDFWVVYHLLSLSKNMRLRVKIKLEHDETMPSVTGVFNAADWYERETYELYGIHFDGHPDLRRLLTDYDFDGYPLRKDFPLEGHVEMYYDEKEKRVAQKPVDLPQEFRHFDKQSPWEAMTGNKARADEDNKFDGGEFK